MSDMDAIVKAVKSNKPIPEEAVNLEPNTVNIDEKVSVLTERKKYSTVVSKNIEIKTKND